MAKSRRLPESSRPGKRSAKSPKSPSSGSAGEGKGGGASAVVRASRPSSLLDTRVVYCGDCLEQLEKLPDNCVDLGYIDPPFNSDRNYFAGGKSSGARRKRSGPLRTDRRAPRPTSTTCGRAACNSPASRWIDGLQWHDETRVISSTTGMSGAIAPGRVCANRPRRSNPKAVARPASDESN